MEAPAPTRCLIRFGVFELDLRAGELRKAGIKVRLQQQPLRVLDILTQRAGEVVTRQELWSQLWPDGTYVDYDRGLNKAIVKLREVLGDSAESPRFIETLPKLGYRFIAPVKESPSSSPPAEPAAADGPPSPSMWSWRRIAMMIGALALVAVLWTSRGNLREPVIPSSPSRIHSLAVLPLNNLSGDPEQEYFADGMTDELISDLSQISGLRVISCTSIMQYKNVKKPLREIGRELNVDAVVEGSVERSGARVRISAQLIQASTDTHLWARSYERDLGDVLTLQDEVAAAIADEVRIKLLPNEKVRLATARPVNPDAHEAYLRGLYHVNKRNRIDLAKSAEYFQQAIALDPGYALAYAGLADTYALRGSMLYMVLSPREAMPQSKAAALQALQIDDKLPEAWATLAYVETLYEWDWAKAEQDFQRAIALNPSYSKAHLWYATLLAALGRHDESIAESKRAHELDPLSLITNSSTGLMLFFARRYDAAIEHFHNVLELDPNFFVVHWQLGLVYEQKQMYEEARSEFEKALTLSPGNLSVIETLAEIDAFSGRKPEARKVLRELQRRSQHEFVSPYILASLNVALGDSNEAFPWLQKAYEDRDNYLIFLRVDPALQSIRSDARFLALVRKMGLG